MSDKTIWAALSDGRYLRIFFNKGEDNKFAPLRVEDLEAYEALNYMMVNGKPLNATGDDAKAREINHAQCHADFLAEHQKLGMFDSLIVAGPEAALASLKDALPEQLQSLIVGELLEDLTVESSDVIENKLTSLIG